jgi:predicted ester cyclase
MRRKSWKRAKGGAAGTGAHDGELAGITPTGNQVTLPGMEIVRISKGKLVEGWEGYDSMTMMRQLGVV